MYIFFIVLSLILNIVSISASPNNIPRSSAKVRNVLTYASDFQELPQKFLELGLIKDQQVASLRDAISNIIIAAEKNNHPKVAEAINTYEVLFLQLMYDNLPNPSEDKFRFSEELVDFGFSTELEAFKFSSEYLAIVKRLNDLNLLIAVRVSVIPKEDLEKEQYVPRTAELRHALSL